MQAGDAVQLMGIHRSVWVACDDETCERTHRWESEEEVVLEIDDEEGGTIEEIVRQPVGERTHREDGPREGVAATVLSFQPAPTLKRPKAGYALPSAPTATTQDDGTRLAEDGRVIADMKVDDHWDEFAIPGAEGRVELLLAGGTIVTADRSDVKGEAS